jgi:hypothetical protein
MVMLEPGDLWVASAGTAPPTLPDGSTSGRRGIKLSACWADARTARMALKTEG